MLEFAIVGFGSRGQMFARLLKNTEHKLKAVEEPLKDGLRCAEEEFNVSHEFCFKDANEFFKCGKICDAVFICTQDSQHYLMAMKALELGYDICLEKPAAVSMEECIAIRNKANELNRKVMLTHVLRYTPFYQCIKSTILSGVLGDIVNINQTENIAYWHFGLSFVRGPWANMGESTPTIIAKCCHDLDIILWLMNKKCLSVSSLGKLFYFKEENAPKGSAKHCADCSEQVRENCVYNAYKVYSKRAKYQVVGGIAKYNYKNIYEVLDEKKEVISQCVFHCDNDAIDNQTVEMEFEDGSLGHLTMTAFSNDCHRTIVVSGTKGEIYGDMEEGTLHLNIFGQEKKIIDANKEFNADRIDTGGGHGGGDYYLLKDFIDYLVNGKESFTRTDITQSIASHLVGFTAEESRLSGGKKIILDKGKGE